MDSNSYIVVTSTDIFTLALIVNVKMEQGYVPTGGVTSVTTPNGFMTFYQAMLKKEVHTNENG